MLKEIKNITFKNSRKIIQFELWFKLFTILITVPMFFYLFKMTMSLTGYNYLTIENFLPFIFNPLTLFILTILLLIAGLYALFDIGTIIILFDASKQDKELELKEAISISLKKSLKVFKPANIGFLFLIVLLNLFLNLGISSSVISSIKIPEFIIDFIKDNTFLNLLYLSCFLLLLILSLRWIYSFSYYFLEDKSFKEACKSSKNLSQKQHLKDLLKITLVQLFVLLSYFIFIILGIVLIIILNQWLKDMVILESILISIIAIFIFISLIVFNIIDNILSYISLTSLFYHHKKRTKEPIIHIDIPKTKKYGQTSNWKKFKLIGATISFISIIFFTYGVIKGDFNLNIEYIRYTEVTAHRGASREYPENTMTAFKAAKELNADWIELDVKQTKDHKIIVSHDTNLKRVTGVNLKTWEATYAEIEKLDAGSLKSSQFKGEKIPLLDDVIKWAKKNNIKLNIELKPTGHEQNFERQVIEIIKENNFISECVVASQVHDVLETVKNIDKNIKTAYVMGLALGDITTITNADYFSVEATSITSDMVDKVHQKGQQIYAWTVNTEESINKMISLNVDNIITDDVKLANELVIKSRTSNLLIELVNLIQTIFG